MYCTDVHDAVLNILETELGISDHLNNNECGKPDTSAYHLHRVEQNLTDGPETGANR